MSSEMIQWDFKVAQLDINSVTERGDSGQAADTHTHCIHSHSGLKDSLVSPTKYACFWPGENIAVR